MQIRGSKGGSSKPHQPYIAPDTVRSVAKAKLLYALTEGEAQGLANGLASIKLNGTPLYDNAGNANFPGVRAEFRSGTVNQSYIQGFPETNNEITVGVELTSDAPWVRAVNNPELSAVRVRLSWDRLLTQQSNGDVLGVRIEYAIDVATDDGAYETVLSAAVDDKSESKYERSHRIDLPAGDSWLVRVRRVTPNANNLQVSDTMVISAVTEVIDAKLRYPHVALLAIEYDSEHFNGNIAKIAVDLEGRLIQVPTNYDPTTRTYASSGPGTTGGVWDGTFKLAYSNNPAWVWYDLVLHPRYGLGRRLNASMVNRWKLYQIAQYCDVMVPDGKGGMEPRYTCNLYLQSRKQAYVALSEIVSIFHGASFWDGAQMVVNADMPEDPFYSYTRANIIGGAIEYKGTAARDRHSIAMVAWDDPAQSYETMYEPVAGDMDSGNIRQLEIGTIGNTRLGQAQRAGLWALKTEEFEDRLTTFRVGLDGGIPRPGNVIKLADELFAGRANGGRIAHASDEQVTIDREAVVKPGDRLSVNLPSGKSQTRQVKSVAVVDGRSVIEVVSPFDEIPNTESVWAIDADDLETMLFRVTAISRPEFHQFEIQGALHVPGKYPAIDNGARIELPPISVIPPGVQAPPTNVRILQSVKIEQTMAITTMTIAYDAVENAVAYDVAWRKDNGEWVKMPRTGGLSVDVVGVYSGQYLARVQAVNAISVQSVPATSMLTAITGKAGQPPTVATITTQSIAWGIVVGWLFPDVPNIIERTELRYSTTTSFADALPLGEYSYPTNTLTQNSLTPGAEHFFWARLLDKTGERGAWYPSEDQPGIRGVASADATEYNALITEQILESALGQQMWSDIEAIPEIQAKLDEISGAGQHDPAQPYLSGSVVFDSGKMYRALQDVPADTPITDMAYWQHIGDYASIQGAIAALSLQTQENTQLIEDIDGVVTATATATSIMQAAMRDDDDGEGDLAGVLNEYDSRAWISELRRTQVTETQVEAIVQQQVGVELGEVSVIVEDISRAVTDIEGVFNATQSTKIGVDVNGVMYTAGYGLGLSNETGVVQSQFVVISDRFAVMHAPNGTPIAVFTVDGGVISMNTALIGDATISFLKIMNDIQSSNYIAGQAGWRLDKNGNFFNNGSGSGWRTVQTSAGATVFEGNTMRVRWGGW